MATNEVHPDTNTELDTSGCLYWIVGLVIIISMIAGGAIFYFLNK